MKVLFWIRSILLKPPLRSAVIKATYDDQRAPNHGAMLNSETTKDNNDLSMNLSVRIWPWQFFASMKHHLSDVRMRSIGRGRRHLYDLVVTPCLITQDL